MRPRRTDHHAVCTNLAPKIFLPAGCKGAGISAIHRHVSPPTSVHMRALRCLHFLLVVLTAGLLGQAGRADAQVSRAHAAAVQPDTVTIAVLGDSLADGVWAGLYRQMIHDKRHIALRNAKNSVGLAAGNLMDLVDGAVQRGRPDAAIMMVGANDRISIFVDNRPVARLGTPAWRQHYATRIANFMERLGRENIPVVWITPPVIRSPEADADGRLIGDLIREAAEGRDNVWVLDARPLSTDESGQYRSHYKDLAGRTQLMRADDGVHFTPPGYEILSSHALGLLRSNLSAFAQAPSPPATVSAAR